MRMRLITVIAAFGLGSAALAQNQAASTAAAPESKPVKEKKICRAEQTTGSMMPTRVCHTQAEWNQIDSSNQVNMRNLREMQQRN